MIKVIAKAVYKDGKVEDAKKMFIELVEKSKSEKGCHSYELYQDINDANVLTMIEEWEDLENLNNHIKSEHYTMIIPEIQSLRIFKEVSIYKKVL